MRNKRYCQWVMTNGKETEEDPFAQLNQILHTSRYVTFAIGHASRQVTFYQHIHGLYCLIGRFVAEFAKQSKTLVRFMTMVCI